MESKTPPCENGTTTFVLKRDSMNPLKNDIAKKRITATLKQIMWSVLFMALLAYLAWDNQSSQLLASSHDRQHELRLWKIGQNTFEAQWCLRCHNLDLKGGISAPSLDNVGVRRGPGRLRQKLLAPQEELSVSQMPSYAHLKAQEIKGLVAFLSSLTPERVSPDNRGRAQMKRPTDEQGNTKFTIKGIKRGRDLFSVNSCTRCHKINGVFDGGSLGPNLTHESQRKRSNEWQLKHLISPISVYTGGQVPKGAAWVMPSFSHIQQPDLEALVALLQSLV